MCHGGTGDLHHRAHLRCTRGIAHVPRDRARPFCGQRRKRQRNHHRPRSELAKIQSNPRGTKQARYSTANVAEGSTVCLEMLSFTLISTRYTPGCRFAEEIDFCNVICSPTLPIVSVDSVFCTTDLLVAMLTMSYSKVAEALCVFSSTPKL